LIDRSRHHEHRGVIVLAVTLMLAVTAPALASPA
jgi:hypothetical protein